MTKVACCWDDGLENDIRLIELLHRYGAKATFNLNYGLCYSNYRRPCGWQFPESPGFTNRHLSLREMPEVYRGFKIASHGYFHATCSNVPTEEYLVDAVENRNALEDLFQQKVDGFVYGCGSYTLAAANALQEAGFRYGRTTENTDDVLSYTHPLILKSSAHFRHENFLELFEQAKRGSGVFYFWGHSCEMRDEESMWAEFERRLSHIAADPETQWIDVADIMDLPRHVSQPNA